MYNNEKGIIVWKVKGKSRPKVYPHHMHHTDNTACENC